MNILHIVIGRPKPETSNGVLKSVYHLALNQANIGHNVNVLSIRKKGSKASIDLSDNAHIHFYKRYIFRFLIDPEIVRYIRSNAYRINIAHIHSGYHPEYWRITRLLVKLKIPFVISPRGSYQHFANNRSYFTKKIYKSFFELTVIEQSIKVHALNSNEAADIFDYGAPANKIRIIPNGIDLNQINEYLEIECPEGKDKNTLTLVYCGRIDTFYKGLDILLAAIDNLVNIKGHKEIQLKLIGPDWKDGISTINKIIERFRLNDHVKLYGAKYGIDKFCLFSASDVFILPSRTEGMPTSVLEAMAYGMPCIVTPETNVDNKIAEIGGCLFVGLSIEDIVRTIENILLDKEKLSIIGEIGRQWVLDHYDYPIVANMHVDNYKMCLLEN